MAPNGDGRVNGKIPCLNDILAFLWFKMKVCTRDTLLNAIKGFYKSDDIVKARDVLFLNIPEGDVRRVRHRKVDDILESMYSMMQQLPTEDAPVFLALDLNNLPCVDLKNIDGVTMVCQQTSLSKQMDEVLREQAAMRAQLAELVRATQEKIARPEEDHVPVDRATTFKKTPVDVRPKAIGTAGGQTDRTRTYASATRTFGRQDRQQHATAPVAGPSGKHSVPDREIREQEYDRGVPPGFVRDDEGFLTRGPRQRRSQRNVVTGKKTGSLLKASNVVKSSRIFVSRVDPELPIDSLKQFVRELTGEVCEVVKLTTKFPSYASYVITCNKSKEEILMNPDEWEEGLLIRKLYGKLTSTVDNTGDSN